ncbi:NUDIX hydrolase [Mariniluteicoccus flavus]
MTEFSISVHVTQEGVGELQWSAPTDAETLASAVSLAADDSLLDKGLHRVEVALPAADAMARRAVHRAGFRLEGVRRQAFRLPDGSWTDVHMYARLADDIVYGPAGFSGVMNTVLATKRVIGHVVLRDSAGRILLCDTHFKDDFELPGGVVEQHESPRLGASRELQEEPGITVEDLRLLVVDWMPPYLGWDDALEFIFDGGVLDEATIARIVKQESEIAELHWVEPERLGEHVSELSARRLRHALGLAQGQVDYIEDGRAGPRP